MQIIDCKLINDIPGCPLMQMFDDEPGWEAKALKQGNLDLSVVYRHRAVMWVPYKAEYQPEVKK